MNRTPATPVGDTIPHRSSLARTALVGGAVGAAMAFAALLVSATIPSGVGEASAGAKPAKKPKTPKTADGVKPGETEVVNAANPPETTPGWKVEVVLQAPQIRHPSVVCAAPDGRVFIGEDPMDMGNDSRIPTDRILCLHPDGKLTVFADKLHAVFGMAYLDGKLYVHHCPKLSVFTDDGTGIGKDHKVLIATTNPNPAPGFNDHIPAQIRPGMDGWIYMAVGDKGVYGATGTDGSKAEIKGGGILRFRPDGSKLEVYSTGTRNHLDCPINAQDELFTYDNTDDGHGWWTRVTHMVDGGFYGYPYDYKPRRPYTLWMMTDFKGGSPCGGIAFEEDGLPAKYRGNLFLCEWGRGQLIRLALERDGATYKIAQREDVLVRGKGAGEFRPVGICDTPAGDGFYITDWAFGGWKRSGITCGRLLKLTHTEKGDTYPRPAWYVPAAMGADFRATTEELVDGLRHPARSVRLVAQRRLADRGAAAVDALTAVVLDTKAAPHARVHAIWALDAIDKGVPGRQAILRVLKDAEPTVRHQAARQLGTRAVKGAAQELVRLRWWAHADLVFRFHAATALGRIGDVQAVDSLLEGVRDADLWVRYASWTALNRIGMVDDDAWPAAAKGLASADAAVRDGVLFALRDAYNPGAVTMLAGFVAAADQPATVRAAALVALGELARKAPPWDGKWWGTQPVKGRPPAHTVDWEGTEPALAAIRGVLESGDKSDPALLAAAVTAITAARDEGALASLQKVLALPDPAGDAAARWVPAKVAVLEALPQLRKPANTADLAKAVAGVLADAGAQPAVLSAAATAAGSFAGGAPGAEVAIALAGLLDRGAPAETLTSALESLALLKSVKAVPSIARLVAHADAKVRNAAVTALGAVGGKDALDALLPALSAKEPELRRAAVTAVGTLKTPAAVEPLLKAWADPDTRFEAVAALANIPDARAVDAYVEGLAGKSATLRTACRKALAAVRDAALPRLEERAGKTGPEGIPAAALGELRAIYDTGRPVPEWSVAGPFDDDGKDVVDPATLKPDALPELARADGKPAKWKKAKAAGSDGMVDLHKSFAGASQCYAYAVADVEVAKAGEAELLAGSDDGLVVWVNGKQVYRNPRKSGGWKADEFRIKASLAAGRNTIVARINNVGGGWVFSVAVPSGAGGRLFEGTAPAKPDPAAFAAFALKTAGDVERGKALFGDLKGLACLKCHKVRTDEGADIGPNLAGIAAKYPKPQLIESVLYPSKQILDGYRQTIILTEDDVTLAGLVRGETPEDVTLVDAEGKRHVIKKKDIAARKESDKSLMPDGLATGLTMKDFADLIAYLETLREAPPVPTKK